MVPSESVLKVKIAPEARHSAYISIDGRRSVELSKGNSSQRVDANLKVSLAKG